MIVALCLFWSYIYLIDNQKVIHLHISTDQPTTNNQEITLSSSSGIKVFIPKKEHNTYSWKMKSANLNKNFNNLFLDNDIKKKINSSVNKLLTDDDFYNKFAIPRKLTFLVHGTPGCGKSALYLTLANTYKMPVYIIKPDIISDNNAVEIISSIPDNSILLFEEIDTFGIQNRNDSIIDQNNMKKLLTMFEILDGYYTLPYKSIIIITTNYLDRLDQALYRKGRVDHVIEFTKPKYDTVKEMFEYYYNQTQMTSVNDDDIKWTLLAKRSFVDYLTAIMNHIDNPKGALKVLS